jgi:hypothetical protein
MHRGLITAATTRGGITTAIRRSGFYPAAHLHERCDLDLPRSARRSCEQQPFEKSPDAKPGLELMVWHKGRDYSNNAPLGMAVVTYRLDRSLPAVGLACAQREEGKGNFANSASF